MKLHVDPAVMRVARAVAREAMASGADAVVLTGSYATGRATAHSDIDLIVIARRDLGASWQGYAHRSGFLVSADRRTAALVRAAFADPGKAANYVPGWRDAVILSDPSGVAQRLQAEAVRWTWARVGDRCDAWVASEVTGWAEEVHKLVAALDARNDLLAAAQRSLLSIHLAKVIAIHRRILYGSDNMLWDLVTEAMGEPWTSAQSRALSIGGESLDASSRAALELYALAARAAWPLLDRRQRAVVGHACTIAGFPIA